MAVAALQAVVAAQTLDDVVARSAAQIVVRCGADDRIGAVRAGVMVADGPKAIVV